MKAILSLLLCLLMMAALAAAESGETLPAVTSEVTALTPAPTVTPEPAEVVTAHYHFWETLQFVSDEVTLRVFDNGTSEVTLQFHYVVDQRRAVPEEPIIRLTKVDGAEGFYGEAPLILHGENNQPDCRFSATIPLGRALGKAKYLTFYICKPDGTQILRLKCQLDDFDSADGKWPTPASTPELPTIPPVEPTATPTMRPTLEPTFTEPPQDSVVVTVPFKLREYTDQFTDLGATLRVYSSDVSSLTIRFKYSKEIPDGTRFRLSMVDGHTGYFGEGVISPADQQGVREAVILFNQQVGRMKTINLEAFAPGSQSRMFKAFYKVSGSTPAAWGKMDPIATVIPAVTATPSPLPEDATPTPAPTEPAGKPNSRTQYALLDPVKHFSLKSAVHNRYEGGLSTLIIKFRYSAELPARPLIRIVQKEYTEGNFGEATAVWDKDDDKLLTVTIVTDQLQGGLRAFRLKCYDEKGKEQFYADFRPDLGSGSYEITMARSMMPTATPEPSETPLPTPTIAPTADPAESPTPAPTEPALSQARHKRTFRLIDKVSGYSHYNAALRRYSEFDVLSVFFRYKNDLPEGTVLRLVRVDTLLDSFGEAIIVPADLKNASADLLCARITSDRIPLNCIGLRVEAVTPEGEVLFTADFYPEEKGYSLENARKLLNSSFETQEE